MCPGRGRHGRASFLARPIEPAIASRYVEEVWPCAPGPADRSLRIVYTPMHGVGRLLAERVLRSAGFADIHVVAEQAEPDGRFPTVAFPNPEEPGALDLAKALAERVGRTSSWPTTPTPTASPSACRAAASG